MSVTHTPFADLIDVTLADEDTNSIVTDNANRAIQENVAMTDNANRAIQGNVAMQVTQLTLETMQMAPPDD